MTNNLCPFCQLENEEIILENELAYVRYDKFPVNNGHILIIPYRHESNYFNLTEDEKTAINALLRETKDLIDSKFRPDGYNIGVNVGTTAGQTVMHVHLIPRYKGDVEDPRGGIRGVIPDKQKY